ncbi:MAG TPA: hypothetical protein VK183_10920, partial [Flavobacterium sp.]|nr:hypothetical protein [Flavobacterium sp.]
MAKQSGIFKIEGKIDELSFYKRGDVYLVRNKGGVSRERLMNDPAFQRTRENISEFGMVASASRILRHGGAPVFRRAYDPRLHNRLMRLMTLAKNLDTLSRRGSRQVAEGFRTAEGRLLLRGFDFN